MSLPFGSFLNQRDVRETKNIVVEQMKTELDMNSHKIINLTDPGANQDAATKYYVDDLVGRKTGTYYYWSALGITFKMDPAYQSTTSSGGVLYGRISSTADNVYVVINVNLPDGAIVDEVVVDGSSSNNWYFLKNTNTGGASTTITNNSVGTTSTNVNETIDNSTYGYFIQLEMDTSDDLDRAQIKYHF